MSEERKISDQIKQFKEIEEKQISLEDKLDELLLLLDKNDVDSEKIKTFQHKINVALERKLSSKEVAGEIKDVSLLNINNLEKLNQLEILLNTNHLDSKQAKKIQLGEKFAILVRFVIGFLMITLGFAMVILPAPPYFEMFTIFNFNHDDGFTLMDLISLIIIAIGIYVIIKSYFKFNA